MASPSPTRLLCRSGGIDWVPSLACGVKLVGFIEFNPSPLRCGSGSPFPFLIVGCPPPPSPNGVEVVGFGMVQTSLCVEVVVFIGFTLLSSPSHWVPPPIPHCGVEVVGFIGLPQPSLWCGDCWALAPPHPAAWRWWGSLHFLHPRLWCGVGGSHWAPLPSPRWCEGGVLGAPTTLPVVRSLWVHWVPSLSLVG